MKNLFRKFIAWLGFGKRKKMEVQPKKAPSVVSGIIKALAKKIRRGSPYYAITIDTGKDKIVCGIGVGEMRRMRDVQGVEQISDLIGKQINVNVK